MPSSTRVLIVDDSPTMRALIAHRIRSEADLEVVGQAGDPLEAREAIKALNPDVITLDVEMPKMDGLDFLERLMRLRPMPVVMVSTLTQRGAKAALAAMELGAIDCVGKPTADSVGDFESLPDKLRAAARARLGARTPPSIGALVSADGYRNDSEAVGIGSSTGGVEALIKVLSAFPANCPPTVVTQHMPASFTASFAARLDKLCQASVAEARDGARLREGQIYIAPGGEAHTSVVRTADGRLSCRVAPGELVSGHRPSVDVLFRSLANAQPRNGVGVILTGMGRDGAEGLLAMRAAGLTTIGQDEATSVVYGMPRAALELGAVEKQLSLNRIGPATLRAAGAFLTGVE